MGLGFRVLGSRVYGFRVSGSRLQGLWVYRFRVSVSRLKCAWVFMGSLAESFLYFGASGLRAYGFQGYGAPTKKKKVQGL